MTRNGTFARREKPTPSPLLKGMFPYLAWSHLPTYDLSYEQFLSLWELTFLECERSSEVTLVEFSMDDVRTEFLRRALTSPTRFELIRQFRDTYLNEWNQGVTYVSGVPLLLAGLRQRYHLVFITNTHHAALVRNHLDQMNVRKYFSTVVISVDFGKKKPSPEIFAHGLGDHGKSHGSKRSESTVFTLSRASQDDDCPVIVAFACIY